MTKKISRRRFLKAGAAAALSFGFNQTLFSRTQSVKKSRVILIRDEGLFTAGGKLNAGVVRKMLDEAILQLTGQKEIKSAWQKMISPDDIVGIKSNEWRPLPTPPEVESAILQRIKEIGVPEKNISVQDRAVLGDPVFKRATALINVRPMRTHAWAGVGSLIKNYIMFVDKPSDYHPDSCADLATIWKLPIVRGKTRLNILVMFTPLFHGIGPHHFNSKYTWRYNGLLVGFDPVAVDATGVRIIQAKRNAYFGEERPIDPPPKHIFLAETRHLWERLMREKSN